MPWGWASAGSGGSSGELLNTNQQGVETDTSGFTLISIGGPHDRDTAQYHSGSASFRISPSNLKLGLDGPDGNVDHYGFTMPSFSITAGAEVTFSAWVFSTNSSVTYTLEIHYYESDTTTLVSTATSGVQALAASTWEEYDLVDTAPSGAAFMFPSFTKAGAVTQCYFDDFSFSYVGSAAASSWQ